MFFGSEILAKSFFFRVYERHRDFFGSRKTKNRDFLGCEKRAKGIFLRMLKKVAIFLDRQILKL